MRKEFEEKVADFYDDYDDVYDLIRTLCLTLHVEYKRHYPLFLLNTPVDILKHAIKVCHDEKYGIDKLGD